MVDYIIGSKDCSTETIPKGVSPFPYTFSEPVPIIIDISFSYDSGAHIDFYLDGYMTGYANNVGYPCVELQLQNGYGDRRGGFIYHKLSAIYQSLTKAHVQVYDNNGNKTEDFYTEGDYNGTTYYAGNIPNAVVHINRCTIPIVFESNALDIGYTYQQRLNVIEDLPAWTDLRNTTDINFSFIPNAKDEEVPETKEYYYYGQAEEYTVNEYGEITRTNSPAVYRGIRVKTQGTLSLYVIDGIDNGILKLGINIHDTPLIAYYSNDGETWQNMAGSPTSLPYDYLYRNWEREIGTFYCLSVTGATIQTNIPIFSTKDESDDYNDTGDGIEDAINYDDISTDNPPSNITGEEDDQTEFGTIGIRSIFSQQYIMSETALSEVANAFYDVTQGGVTGIFEDIKKGCEMYGDTVVDDIESLVFYPVNLNTVFSSGIISQNYIYFGGYRFAMQNSVNRILFPNGYYDFGTFTVETTFGDNIRSYEPYTKLYCYLAYIGWVQLDMKKYLHKTVNIRYYIDTRANTCCAVLIANGVMCDYFNGQIGVSMPLRATDMNAYANAQIQALLGFGSGVGGSVNNAQKVGSQLAQAGATAGEMVAGAGALGVLGVGIQGTKTLYGLTQNNINNFNHAIGGSSSIINMMLPQECLFMFEVQEAMPTEYERELVGLPSNASGTVGTFSGYLECEQVNLVCSGATAKEQAEILRYLYNGVYI